MKKKQKVHDIPDYDDQADVTRNVTRISLTDLPDATRVDHVLPLPPVEKAISVQEFITPVEKKVDFKKVSRVTPEDPVIERIPARPVLERISFDRSILHLYCYKSFSFILVIAIFELTIHLLKFLEGVDVLDPYTFTSFFFGTYVAWNPAKVMGFFAAMYLITPKEKIYANSKGIYCSQVDLVYWFYSSRVIYLKWEEIAKVDCHMRFMEPFIFFLNGEGKVIGQMDFSLTSPKDFFYYVEQHAGKNHPLSQIKSGSF
ncbi:MAG TPA: hypothetical protein VNJ08_01625 [Bacteriovoracaceae bacterium]|nr:hypothetical protein [Bacteriovoracaceae bacterium]